MFSDYFSKYVMYLCYFGQLCAKNHCTDNPENFKKYLEPYGHTKLQCLNFNPRQLFLLL